MSDVVFLRDLRIMTICGALPEEQERAQPFRFDIDVEIDLRRAGETDDLDATVNYGDLADRVVDLVTSQRFVLLERMVHVVAELALSYPSTTAVTVEVQKLRPPIGHAVATSGVRIRRTQPS